MRKILALALTLLFFIPVFASNLPQKPAGHIYDGANVLNPSQEQSLEQFLRQYEDSTSNQIAVVTEADINGEDPFERSYDIAKYWGVGGKQNNNGVLLYIAIKDREMFIQVGRGLEGAIPDAIAKRIVDFDITPQFKQQNYYQGIINGCAGIMKAAAGEYKSTGKKDSKGLPGWMIGLFIILFLIFMAGGRRMRGGGGTYGSRGGGGYFGGGYVGGGGWSSGGGGGGGSSWGGFGGGSFGGGGAGGSW